MNISLLISFISLCFAVVSFITGLIWSKKINNINLEAEYFKEIYKKYLIVELPIARRYIRLEGTKIKDTDQLIRVLNNMRVDSLYFFYAKPQFYEELEKACDELEDYLINIGNEDIEAENLGNAFNGISDKISQIYEIINNNYLNMS